MLLNILWFIASLCCPYLAEKYAYQTLKTRDQPAEVGFSIVP